MRYISLLPSKSVFVASKSPGRNFSGNSDLYAGVNSMDFVYRTLLDFDISLLPEDINIQSAFLSLHVLAHDPINTEGQFTPYAIASEWEEHSATWNNQPSYDPQIAGSTMEVTLPGIENWNVTNIVKLWVSDAIRCHGLLLKSSEDISDDIKRFFFSRESKGRRFMPALDIAYSSMNDFCLGSRDVVNITEKHVTDDDWQFSGWQNTSSFSTFSFFVLNIGNCPADAFLQVSPDGVAALNEPPIVIVEPCALEAFVVQKYGFFTRLAFRSLTPGKRTLLKMWFQAQV